MWAAAAVSLWLALLPACSLAGPQGAGEKTTPAGLPAEGISVAGLDLDTLILVPFRWPPVGAMLGDRYVRVLEDPVGQYEMTREMHIGLVRSLNSRIDSRFDALGYDRRVASRVPRPAEKDGAARRPVLHGRLVNFSIDSHQLTGGDSLAVDLGVMWDLIDGRSGRTVYTVNTWARLAGETIGDRLGSFLSLSRRAIDETLTQLLGDSGLVRALRELGGSN